MKKSRILIILIFTVAILAIIGLQLILHFSLVGSSYWLMLLFIIPLIRVTHLKSAFSLTVALIFFFLSSLLITINLPVVGEVLMRISLIFWMLGITQALIEYRKLKVES